MLLITPEDIKAALPYSKLCTHLHQAFAGDYTVPLRHHHDFNNPDALLDSTLLLMPAWQSGGFLGVKIVSIAPENHKYQLPSIQGVYLLFDAVKGTPLLQCDAKILTNIRTAAASALAADFLANPDSNSLLMIGTGSLSPFLIEAHCSIRPIKKVWIWGRNPQKAEQVLKQISLPSEIEIQVVEKLEPYLSEADIISSATMSKTALIAGSKLRPGQHVDLVGSYKPDMREADDTAIIRAEVFVDTLEGACKETGDIAIPIKTGILKKDRIQGDLFGLCRGLVSGRKSQQAITLFKSVGHALEDLAAAQLIYEAHSNQNQ